MKSVERAVEPPEGQNGILQWGGHIVKVVILFSIILVSWIIRYQISDNISFELY